MNSMPLYTWRVLELMSRQVTLSVYFCLYLMPTYVVGVIYAIPVYKIVQRVLMFVTVKSYILTVRGHNFFFFFILCLTSIYNIYNVRNLAIVI